MRCYGVPTPLTTVPATFVAGDSLVIEWSHADYPRSAGWTSSLAFAGASVLDLTGAAVSGAPDAHGFTVSAAVSAGLVAGTYQGRIRCTLASETVTVESGRVLVTPDLGSLVDGEILTWEERTLAIVEDAIAGTLASESKMYIINGRQVMNMTPRELIETRAYLMARINIANGGGIRGGGLQFGSARTSALDAWA